MSEKKEANIGYHTVGRLT